MNLDAMLVFDIDGVLTNPKTMEFNDQALKRIVADLEQNIPVALNTGRSTEWVFERVLPALSKQLNASALNHLLLVAEKGGVKVVFKGGAPDIIEDTSVSLPAGFMQEAPSLLERPAGDGKQLAAYIFWDAGKRTMASFEKRPEVPIEDFERVRSALRTAIEELLRKYGLKDFRIDETVIATDIEHVTAGKHKGAEQVLAWLKSRGENVQEFFSFGDSPSDEVMAEVFAADSKSTFVYVGAKELPAQADSAHVRVLMYGQFDTDTAAYLEQMQ